MKAKKDNQDAEVYASTFLCYVFSTATVQCTLTV